MPEEKKKSWFRRHWILTGILGFFLLFVIIGMFQGFSDESQSTQNEATPYNFNERFTHGDFAYTFHSVEEKSKLGNILGITEAKGVFLIFEVTIENVDKETNTFWGDAIQLIDTQERIFDTDDEAWIYLGTDEAFIYEQMQPNLPKRGKLIFDVPEGIDWRVRIAKSSFSSNYAYVKK